MTDKILQSLSASFAKRGSMLCPDKAALLDGGPLSKKASNSEESYTKTVSGSESIWCDH
jgi:hypothetical protein